MATATPTQPACLSMYRAQFLPGIPRICLLESDRVMLRKLYRSYRLIGSIVRLHVSQSTSRRAYWRSRVYFHHELPHRRPSELSSS